MMIGMMVRMVAMMCSTETHILLVAFSDKQVLYVIHYFRVKPRLGSVVSYFAVFLCGFAALREMSLGKE